MVVLSPSKQLKKQLSLFGVYTLATGATLSSGFFLLPGLAAKEAGPAVVLAYLVAVIPLLPGILSKIELATAMPRAGGVYFFMDRSLGPLMGTIGGMGTWFALSLKASFALIGIGAYLQLLAPGASVYAVAAAVAIAFGILNLFGAHKSSVVQAVLVIGLLGLLCWFIASGMPHTRPEAFENFFDKDARGMLMAAGMVCISYMGLTKVASVAEEVKNPERNLTLGIFLALLTAVVVYGLGTTVIVGLVDKNVLYAGAEPSLTPVAEAAKSIVAGNTGVIIMSVAAILAFLSVGNASILSASRYPLAMSRDQLLPSWLARLNRFQTPHFGVLVTVGLIVLFVIVLDPTKIAKLASSFLLVQFAFNNLAVVVMRESQIESYDPGFRAPLYPWLQILGVLGPLVLIVVMGWLPMVFTAGLILMGSIWYFYYARKRVDRGGAIYHLFARLGRRQFAGLDRELRGILKEKGLRDQDPYDHVVARAAMLDEPSSTNFEQLIQKASKQLATQLPLSADDLARGFMDGTRVGATPVAKGVALPHMRLAGLSEPVMVIARTANGIHIEVDVDHVEHSKDQQIYAVVFLVSPEDDPAQHLRILAQVAQRIDDGSFMNQWLGVKNKQMLRPILMRGGRFLDVDLAEDKPGAMLIGQSAGQLNLPDDCLLAMIVRGKQEIESLDEVKLCVGDRLTFVGPPKAMERLKHRYELGDQPPMTKLYE